MLVALLRANGAAPPPLSAASAPPSNQSTYAHTHLLLARAKLSLACLNGLLDIASISWLAPLFAPLPVIVLPATAGSVVAAPLAFAPMHALVAIAHTLLPREVPALRVAAMHAITRRPTLPIALHSVLTFAATDPALAPIATAALAQAIRRQKLRDNAPVETVLFDVVFCLASHPEFKDEASDFPGLSGKTLASAVTDVYKKLGKVLGMLFAALSNSGPLRVGLLLKICGLIRAAELRDVKIVATTTITSVKLRRVAELAQRHLQTLPRETGDDAGVLVNLPVYLLRNPSIDVEKSCLSSALAG